MRIDNKTIAYISDFYNNLLYQGTYKRAITSNTENFGYDFPVKNMSTGTDEAHVEAKTKNCPYKEWSISTTGSCLFFGLAPSTAHTINLFPKYWESKPTQAEISRAKHAENEKGERVRWFCLNAASGAEFDFGDCPHCPKWLGMFQDPMSELAILFSDGILRFDHEQLLSAVASYGYLYTWGSEEYMRSSGRYWQFKVFLDIDKGTFYPCEVPQNILPQKKVYS